MSDSEVHYVPLFVSAALHAPSTSQQFIKNRSPPFDDCKGKKKKNPVVGPVFGSGSDAAISSPDVLQAACLRITVTLLFFFWFGFCQCDELVQ